jgi:hypothetical protein
MIEMMGFAIGGNHPDLFLIFLHTFEYIMGKDIRQEKFKIMLADKQKGAYI